MIYVLGVFDGRPADYLFLLIFNAVSLIVSFHVVILYVYFSNNANDGV